MSLSFYALPPRKCDSQGCGHYGAGRGAREHNGIDLACNPGTAICAPIAGEVTKIGWPYDGEPAIRYVQITADGYDYRVFYVDPRVSVGDTVTSVDVIGASQALDSMTRGGTQHVHFEIKRGRDYIDPTPLYNAMREIGGYL